MPNIVQCQVVWDEEPNFWRNGDFEWWNEELAGPSDRLQRITPWGKLEQAQGRSAAALCNGEDWPRSFDYWVPRPTNLLSEYQRTFRLLTQVLGEAASSHLNEIAWMRREWGCSGDGWEFLFYPEHGKFYMELKTAWSAPLPLFLALARIHGPLLASWYEEYGQSAGHLRFTREENKVVATEVVGFRGDTLYGGEYCKCSIDEYLTQLRDKLWRDPEVPVQRYNAASGVPVHPTVQW